MTEQEYRDDASRRGYDAPVTKNWQPGLFNDDHAHAQDLYLLVVEGGMTVIRADRTQRLAPGDACEVPAGEVPGERAGPDGVTFLVALRDGNA